MKETLTLQFDGGSRGNPGPAGIGVVIRSGDQVIRALGDFIPRATNNVAEYKALIRALEEAVKLGAKNVEVLGDSELIVRQMNGEYRVRHPDLKPLYERARELQSQFESATISHNYRDHNELADKLANKAMDKRGMVTDDDMTSAMVEPIIGKTNEPKVGDRWTCARCGCVIEVRKPTRVRPHQLRPFNCQCGNPMHE